MGEYADMAMEQSMHEAYGMDDSAYEAFEEMGFDDYLEVRDEFEYSQFKKAIMIFDYETLIRQSDKAFFIRFPTGFEFWLPKSKCKISENKKKVGIPRWLVMAKEKEMRELQTWRDGAKTFVERLMK